MSYLEAGQHFFHALKTSKTLYSNKSYVHTYTCLTIIYYLNTVDVFKKEEEEDKKKKEEEEEEEEAIARRYTTPITGSS